MAGQIISKVTAGGGEHLISSSFYGTCATAQGTALKEVIINDPDVTAASFKRGMLLSVKFTSANTHATPTMTIFNNSGTEASPTKGSTTLLANRQIMRYGTTKPGNTAKTSWNAGSVINFVYDGTYWQMVGWINDADTDTVSSVYVNTGASTAAKVGTLTSASWASTTQPRYALIDLRYANTAASALTLNVASHGAKPVWLNGEASSASNYTWPQGTYIGYFDGTKWHIRTDGKIPGPSTNGTIEEILISESSPATTDDYTKIWIEI